MTLISMHNSEGCIGRCDAKCYDAKEPACHCMCGGRNHGVGERQAVENTRELAEDWIDKMKEQDPDLSAKVADVVTQQPLF